MKEFVQKAAGVPLTQSAEPPIWMVAPPGEDDDANAIEPSGAEAPPRFEEP